ncbi:MAG: hypothetical protein ABIO70_05955 [Pseudomonadota bacterium]
MIPVPDVAWPEPVLPEDPYAGDELLPWPPPRDPRQARFLAAAQEWALGRRPLGDPSLRALAAEAGLLDTPDPVPQPRSLDPEADLPADDWFAHLAEDRLPDLGLTATARVLGPWADEGPSRRQRIVAAGVLAFSPYMRPRLRPLERWLHERKQSLTRDRLAVRAVDRVPALLWEVLPAAPPRPLLPLPTLYLPPAPVRQLPAEEGMPALPLPAGTWLARCFPGPDGWYAALALPMPRCPDPAWVQARMELELWRCRVLWPAFTWVDLLRERAEVLYRCCHEWLWITEEVAP